MTWPDQVFLFLSLFLAIWTQSSFKTMQIKRLNICVLKIFELCIIYLYSWSNKLPCHVLKSNLCTLDFMIYQIEKEVHIFWIIFSRFWGPLLYSFIMCDLFWLFSKILVAKEKHPYLHNSKTQMFSLLICSVLFHCWLIFSSYASFATSLNYHHH